MMIEYDETLTYRARKSKDIMERSIQNSLLKCNRLVRRTAPREDVERFARSFKEQVVPVDLIRIGREHDGGYLIPNDLRGVKYCFSPGVSSRADFEEQLAENYGIRSFMADASVTAPPFDNPHFDFDQKYLGSRTDGPFITLQDWVDEKVPNSSDNDLILQMDIEGAEFGVLIETPLSVLKRFRMMVIEVHQMDAIFDPYTLPLLQGVFDKVHESFSIAHLHANNCCGIARRDIGVPRVFEITYIRKDRIPDVAKQGRFTLPHALDSRNVVRKTDIVMPTEWWA